MVSKIQKREKHLATNMDRKVLMELLTHSHGGSKVDEEASYRTPERAKKELAAAKKFL